jgi:rod shape-determining protein MreC
MRGLEVETRRGRPVLLVVLVVVSIILVSVYFREGDEGVLHRSRTVALAASEPVAIAGEWASTPFRRLGDLASGLAVSRSEFEELKAQNEELRARLAELEEAGLEAERLRGLVGFVEEQDFEYVGVRVIGRPTTSWEGALTIDRGENDGVEIGMPVIAAQGLVGQVVEVAPGSSKVRLITDQRSGVAALVQSSRAEGIVSGTLEGDMILDFVPEEEAPVTGDVVLTSGMGGVYPKGLVVGDVVDVYDERHRLYPTIEVESRVPISEIEEVLVITVPGPPEGDQE